MEQITEIVTLEVFFPGNPFWLTQYGLANTGSQPTALMVMVVVMVMVMVTVVRIMGAVTTKTDVAMGKDQTTLLRITKAANLDTATHPT